MSTSAAEDGAFTQDMRAFVDRLVEHPPALSTAQQDTIRGCFRSGGG